LIVKFHEAQFATWQRNNEVTFKYDDGKQAQLTALHDGVGEVLRKLERLEAKVDRLSQQTSEIRSLVGPFGVPMPDGSLLVYTQSTLLFFIDPSDLIMSPYMIVNRHWEADVTQCVLSATNSSTVFVDIGANFGYFTCLAANKIGSHGTGRVISFEPNPSNVDLLRKNMIINWSMCPIEIHDCALGERTKTMELFIPVNKSANASFHYNMQEQRESGRYVGVNVRRLDDVLPVATRVDLMKIDVEGYEHAVLDGARRVISESNTITIVMEWSEVQMAEAGFNCEQMFGLFVELKLTAHRLPEDLVLRTLRSPPLTLDDLRKIGYANIVLKRSE
jgi:FkbM family methyltransferase